MGVRSRLALRVHTRTPVLNDRARLSQFPRRLDGECRDAPAAIIGDQHTFTRPVHGQVARPGAPGALPVEQPEPARLLVHAERAHRADLFAVHNARLTDRIEEAPVGMDRQETRAGRGHRQLRRRELAGSGVEAGNINALAPGTGISAEINPQRAAGGNGGCGHADRIQHPAGEHRPKEAAARQQVHPARKHEPPPFTTRKTGPGAPRALLDSPTKRQAPKSEIRNLKAERRPKSEARSPKSLLWPLC